MPRLGFEPTVPEFERARTVHALECAATVICSIQYGDVKLKITQFRRKVLEIEYAFYYYHYICCRIMTTEDTQTTG
jgi:hypothetical protein